MRHGRKSERRRFDGHKAHLAIDPESRLITAVDVLAGNAPDHERALGLVEQSEANAESVVEEVVGDCAYGDGNTRKTFAEAGHNLVAKVASRRGGAQFPKEDFLLDLESMSCVCPAGQRTQKVVSISSGDRYGAPGTPLRAFQKSEAFAPYRKLRQAAEHRLARMMQLGVRQARYFGRTKTLFQLLIAASVANLTLVARRVGFMRDRNHLPDSSLYTRLRFICVSLRVRHAVATSEPGFPATLLERF